MERSFSVEAKSFRLSAKIGSPNLRLEERRKGFVGFIFASVQCSEWLVETVESAIQVQVKEEIAKTFREGDKAMMVHGGVNKAGRYLEVSFLAVGGRKGVIWLPEGRFGWGWRRFAGELRRLLEAQRLAVGSEEVGDLTAKVVSGSSSAPGIDPKVVSGSSSAPGIDPKRSYVQALCAIPAVEESATPLRILDLFPVSTCFESHSVGEGLRVAIDCAALEGGRPSLVEAAGFVRASETGVDEGVKKLLGRLEFKLDRILSGLPLRPIRRRRKKCKILGRDSVLEKETGPLGAEGPNPGLDPGLGLVSKPGPDPGCVLIEDLKPALFMGKPGDAPSFAANQEPTPPSPKLSMVPSPDCTSVVAPSFAANQEPSLPSPELSTVPSSISLDCTPVAPPGSAANQEPSPRSLELSTVSSPISPECMPEPFDIQPPSSRQESDNLGAPEDVPSESERSAGVGSAPGIVLLMDSAPVNSSVPHTAFADAGSGSSPVVRQSPPVIPLMKVALSQAEAHISQNRLVAPESAVVEPSALVHNCGFVVDGSSMGVVSLSDCKMVSNPTILEALSMSGSGVEVSVEALVEISPAITPSITVPAVSVAGLEPLGFEDPGDSSVQGIGSVPVPVELAGEKTLALVYPPVEQDPAEESDLITVVAPPDAGDGSFQMPRPGFSVPSAEEFIEFLPAGSLNKDWQDFFSSLHTDRRGMSDSELIKEAFALPWEVDEPASPPCRDKEASSAGDEGGTQMERPHAPMKSLLRRGFLGPRNVSPHPVVLKEVLPAIKTLDISTEDVASSISGPVISPSLLEDKQGVHSIATIVLPSSKVCASSDRSEVTESDPINSSVSWYNRRVKGKMAKQLNKNKELIAEAVGVLPVGGGDRVTDALHLAPVLGLSWGGEDKKLRDIIETTVPKVKGMRELKNLDCDISPVKDKRRRGWSESKNARSFPPEVH
jgi:hypothetical protein